MKKDEFERRFEESSDIDFDFNNVSSKINYEKYTIDKKKTQKKNAWMWIIPSMVTCLTLAIVLPLTLSTASTNNTSTPINNELNRLTTPKTNKISTNKNNSISLLTYQSYTTFTNNFVPLCFDESIRQKGEVSLGVSIPDAYLAFAITTIVSEKNVQDEFLSYLGLTSLDELKITTNEIIETMCTLYENNKGELFGGYNLNSIWLNPAKTILKEKDESLYQDLEEIFDASIYHEALTSKSANEYLKQNGLKDKPTPEIMLDDDNPFAAANMSVFYCIDGFSDNKEYYQSQYESKTHKMEYTFNETSKSVDYIERKAMSQVYEGKNFVGATSTIQNLNISYYLPDINTAPSNILSNVLAKNYHEKESINEFGESTNNYLVTINQPYFKLNNRIDLTDSVLSSIFPEASNGGVNERLVSSVDKLRLTTIIQQSIMTFDYNGFYSCSVTIMGEAGESTPMEERYLLNLNHPYLFTVNQPFVQVENRSVDIPMVIGEIIDPNYE